MNHKNKTIKTNSFSLVGDKYSKILKESGLVILTAALIVGGFFVVNNALALSGINITSPNGGEYWSGTQKITWTADCEAGDLVNIYYSSDNFVSSNKIVDGLSCSSGVYDWDTNSVSDGSTYKIKVADKSDVAGVYYTSDAFTIDNTEPVITVPAEQTFEATGQLTTPVSITPATATDNLDPSPVITYTPDHDFPVGTTEVTWTATDAAGNFSTAVSNVIIKDTIEPVITLIGSDFVILEYGFTYTDAGATALDIVDGDLTSSIVVNNPVDTSVLGLYTVTYNVSDAALNPATEITRIVKVVKRSITVTADTQSKTYGEIDPALTYTSTPDLVVGDSFSGSLTRVAGENVGTYAITQGTLALSNNYNLTYVGANLTINKAVATVSATANNKTYDGTTDATASLIVSGAVLGDTLTATYANASFVDRNAGAGKTVNVIGIALVGEKAANYSFNDTATATADITVRTIKVTAATDVKVYDGNTSSAEEPTITDGALAMGDTATWTQTFDNKNVAINKTLTPVGSVNDGNNGNNYAVTFVNDTTGVITAKTLTVTATGQDKVYDGTTDAIVTFSDDRVAGDILVINYGSANFVDENVGADKIVNVSSITVIGTDAINYTFNTTAETTADITARSITVTAEAKSKTYGDSDPDLTYTYSPGLVSGDAFTGVLTRDAGENVGTYAITQGTLALSNNYNLTYVGADLTINKKTIDVTAEAKSKTYGDSDPSLTYTYTPDLIDGDSFSGSLTRDLDEDVGTYAITQGTLALSGNYTLNYTGVNLTITQREITVTAVTDTKEYDGNTDSIGIPTITSGTLATGDTAIWTQSFDNKNVGMNKSLIPAGSVNDGNSGDNYAVDFVNDATGVITARPIIVTANDKFKNYGEPDPVFDYTYAPDLVVGDSFSGSLTRDPGEDIGVYAITQGDLTLSDNYDLTYFSGILTIQDITAPVTTDNVPAGWQNSDVTVTLSCDDSVGGNSGCSKVYYTTNGTDPTTESSSVDSSNGWQFTVSTDGEYTIKYRGEDVVSNLEVVRTASNTLQLDKTVPVITNLTPGHTSVTSDVTSEISAEFVENGSGIDEDSVAITVDGIDQTDYATVIADGVSYVPIIAMTAGQHLITVNAADMVGNSANQASWSFIVNPTVQSIAVSIDKTTVPADGVSYAVITVQVLDNGAPVESATVNFASTLGTVFDATITGADGRATAKLKSAEAGSSVVTASYNGGDGLIQGTVNITFTEVITDTTAPTATQYPADNAVDVATNVQPYINFSEAMDENTLTGENIQLRKIDFIAGITASLVISTNNNGTTRVTITPSFNLDYGAQYYFFIGTGVKDLAGNSLNPTWTSSNKLSHEFTVIAKRAPVTSYDILLTAGWNLISLPLIPTSNAIDTVLLGISDKVDVVWYYDTAAGEWKSFKPGVGGSLTAMEDGKGYWIFMDSADTLTINGSETPAAGPQTLPAYSVIGNKWNLIGFKSAVSKSVKNYITQIGDDDVLWVYKNGSYNLIHPTGVDIMEPGYGYWLYPYGNGYSIVPTN